MKVTYDKEANAFYIKMSNKGISRTKLVKSSIVTVDLDKDGEIVGIELLFIKGIKETKEKKRRISEILFKALRLTSESFDLEAEKLIKKREGK